MNNLIRELEYTERLIYDSNTKSVAAVEHSVRHKSIGLLLSKRTDIYHPNIVYKSLEFCRQHVYEELTVSVWRTIYGDLLKDFMEMVYSPAKMSSSLDCPIISGIDNFLKKWDLSIRNLPTSFDFKTINSNPYSFYEEFNFKQMMDD